MIEEERKENTSIENTKNAKTLNPNLKKAPSANRKNERPLIKDEQDEIKHADDILKEFMNEENVLKDSAAEINLQDFINKELLSHEKELRKRNQKVNEETRRVFSLTDTLIKSITTDEPLKILPETETTAVTKPKPKKLTKKTERLVSALEPKITEKISEDQLVEDDELPTQATHRYLKAKVQILTQELEKMANEQSTKVN
jgi:polyhydroxyalkanoate synthesis regulator phasin